MTASCRPTHRTDPACPFHTPSPRGCLAALGDAASRRPQPTARCASADHDACPTFLAKILRSLRPHPFQGQRDFWTK